MVILTGITVLYLFILLFNGSLSDDVQAAPKNFLLKEDKIKASYVFNFIRFIKWPDKSKPRPGKPIVVCVIEKGTRFLKSFQPVIGKKVDGHILQYQKIRIGDSLEDCNLFYISSTESGSVSKLIEQARQYNILTVSDISAFCEKGGLIGMVTLRGRVKVEINLGEAREQGFNISSNLLEVANIVGDGDYDQ